MAMENISHKENNTRDRIISLIEKNESSFRSFEDKFGLKRGTVSEWKRNKMYNYMDYIVEIAKEYNTTTDWLLGKAEEDTPELKYVPVKGWICLGQLLKEYDHELEYVKFPTEVCPTGELFALRVVGDSFMPVAVDGDIIVCNKIIDKSNGKICVVTLEGDTFICRVKISSEWITLFSTNPMNKELRFSKANAEKLSFTINGIIVQLIRDFN